MEVVFAIPLLFVPFFMPFIAGQMAKSFGRNFWPWFFIGIPLPFIANIILLCLPDKTKKVNESELEGNNIVPGYFLENEDVDHRINNEDHYSARA